MAEYTVNVGSAALGVAQSECAIIELKAAANTQFYLKRARVSYSTPIPTDDASDVVIRRPTATETATGLTTGTIVPLFAGGRPTATTTAKIITGTVAATLSGSIVVHACQNTKGTFEWVARDEDDYIWSDVGGFVDLNVIEQGGSANITAMVEFGE